MGTSPARRRTPENINATAQFVVTLDRLREFREPHVGFDSGGNVFANARDVRPAAVKQQCFHRSIRVLVAGICEGAAHLRHGRIDMPGDQSARLDKPLFIS